MIPLVDDMGLEASFHAELLRLQGKPASSGGHCFTCGGTILACRDPVADGDGTGDGWHPHLNQENVPAGRFQLPDPCPKEPVSG